MRRPVLAALNLALAAGILVAGLPSMMAALRLAPAEIVIGEADAGQTVTKAELDDALRRAELAAKTSPAAHQDIALLLLAGADGGEGGKPAERAAEELRRYLAEVPGDARGWTELARAEFQAGRRPEAVAAYKMSMLLAPYVGNLVLWRCGFGLDFYAALDDDDHRLLGRQFALAAENQTEALVTLVRQRKALVITRAMLTPDPAALAKFEARWAIP